MNDFTKQELIDLNIIIAIWNVRFRYPEDKETIKLQNKIESMINDYCEHVKDIELPGECSICRKELCFECSKTLS
jgi:hypothetical protein